MSAMPPLVDPAGTNYEEVPSKTGAGGLLLTGMHLALGGVTLALAIDGGFAEGKASFDNDVWRIVFGAVGGGLVFLALRAIVRNMTGGSRKLTPQLHRRGALWGRGLIALGLVFLAMAVIKPFGDLTVAFSSWAKPFYVGGSIYLMLLGFVMQWNPTRHIRQQRVAKGEGRPGVARIVRASDTGTSVNDAPQVKIEFELEVGGQTHLVSDKIVMQRARLALLIPGSTVDVLVDSADPTVFHIDWDSWKGP